MRHRPIGLGVQAWEARVCDGFGDLGLMVWGFRFKGSTRVLYRVSASEAAGTEFSQRLQYPLIKEYTSEYSRIPRP